MARLAARLKACPDEELEFSHRIISLLRRAARQTSHGAGGGFAFSFPLGI